MKFYTFFSFYWVEKTPCPAISRLNIHSPISLHLALQILQTFAMTCYCTVGVLPDERHPRLPDGMPLQEAHAQRVSRGGRGRSTAVAFAVAVAFSHILVFDKLVWLFFPLPRHRRTISAPITVKTCLCDKDLCNYQAE